jgi:hypothetical protein
MVDRLDLTLALPANTAAAVNTKAPVPMKILLAFIIKGLKKMFAYSHKGFRHPLPGLCLSDDRKIRSIFRSYLRMDYASKFLIIYFILYSKINHENAQVSHQRHSC